MPGRRAVKKGSFDSHFDELVTNFEPALTRSPAASPHTSALELHERRDIHGFLFRQAWRLDADDDGGR